MTSPISSSFKIVPFVENIFRMILRILIRFKSSAKPVYRKKKEWQCFCIGKNEKDALQKKERTLDRCEAFFPVSLLVANMNIRLLVFCAGVL